MYSASNTPLDTRDRITNSGLNLPDAVLDALCDAILRDIESVFVFSKAAEYESVTA